MNSQKRYKNEVHEVEHEPDNDQVAFNDLFSSIVPRRLIESPFDNER